MSIKEHNLWYLLKFYNILSKPIFTRDSKKIQSDILNELIHPLLRYQLSQSLLSAPSIHRLQTICVNINASVFFIREKTNRQPKKKREYKAAQRERNLMQRSRLIT
jgi:hypothetical protein